MAKTIKEMATETFPNAVNYNSHCSNLNKRYGYIVGANAVLEEIVKSIFFNREYATKEDIFEAMTKKIEELKGE